MPTTLAVLVIVGGIVADTSGLGALAAVSLHTTRNAVPFQPRLGRFGRVRLVCVPTLMMLLGTMGSGAA